MQYLNRPLKIVGLLLVLGLGGCYDATYNYGADPGFYYMPRMQYKPMVVYPSYGTCYRPPTCYTAYPGYVVPMYYPY